VDAFLSLALGLAAALASFFLQFPLFFLSGSEVERRHIRVGPALPWLVATLASTLLSLLGLLATVASLRGYWQLLDLVEAPHPLLPTLLPGILGSFGLFALRVASSLHGGVVSLAFLKELSRPDLTLQVASHKPGSLWPSWLLTSWLIKEQRSEIQSEEVEAFMRI